MGCKFKEFPNNPVYNPVTTKAYYQTVLFDRHKFNQFGTAFYKMWYDFASLGGIALATSGNGKNWIFQANMTGLDSRARHSRVLFDRNVFGIGVPYRIWYWDSEFVALDTANPGDLRMLRTAKSMDGINWFSDTTLGQDTSSPLVNTVSGSINSQCYGPADVLFFENNPAILNLKKPFKNRYVIYYNISDGSHEELALAVSADGVFWRREGPIPVLPRGGPGTWDENKATEHAVVLMFAEDDFVMLYNGGILESNEGIGCAFSKDGLIWEKLPDPIFSINDGVTWRNGRTHNPWVLFDRKKFRGHGDEVRLKLWMTGAPKTDTDDINIGYATRKKKPHDD